MLKRNLLVASLVSICVSSLSMTACTKTQDTPEPQVGESSDVNVATTHDIDNNTDNLTNVDEKMDNEVSNMQSDVASDLHSSLPEGIDEDQQY